MLVHIIQRTYWGCSELYLPKKLLDMDEVSHQSYQNKRNKTQVSQWLCKFRPITPVTKAIANIIVTLSCISRHTATTIIYAKWCIIIRIIWRSSKSTVSNDGSSVICFGFFARGPDTSVGQKWTSLVVDSCLDSSPKEQSLKLK